MIKVGNTRRLGGIGARSLSPSSQRPFDAATLFAAGEFGYFFDPSDSANMFQNSAGTTAVTAYTDPIGYLTDLSGNGQHFTQATDASRLTWQADGSYSRVDANGINQFLERSVTMPAGKRQVTIGIAFKFDTLTGDAILAFGGGLGTGNWSLRYLQGGGRLYVKLSNAEVSIGAGVLQAGTAYILTLVLDNNNDGSVTPNITGKLNDEDITLQVANTVGDFQTGTHRILALGNGTQNSDGGINGMIVRYASSSEAELDGIRSLLNARIGAI